MIWVLFAVMALICALYLAPAFLGDAAAAPAEDRELRDGFAQIDALRADTTLPEAERRVALAGLERRLLDRPTGPAAPAADPPPRRSAVASLAALAVMAVGVYGYTGWFGPDAPPTPSGADPQASAQLSSLVDDLEARLQGERANDPAGWLILARSRMSLERFEPALQAYDRAVALAEAEVERGGDGDASLERLRDERAQAQRFIARRMAPQNRPGPSAQDVRDAQDLSEEERSAMIDAMVDGLAARLADDPGDAQGWVRLIRARLVLGDREAAARDVADFRKAFATQPDVVADGLARAGWDQP